MGHRPPEVPELRGRGLTAAPAPRLASGDTGSERRHPTSPQDRLLAAEARARTLAAQHAAVANLGELAVAEPDVRAVFDRACAVVADVLDADVVSLLLEDATDRDELRLVAGVGFRDGDVGLHRVPAGARSMAGFTLDRDEAVVVDDLAAERRFEPPWLLLELGVTTGVAAVLRPDARAVGTLSAYRRSGRPFTPDEVNVLQSIANLVTRAIERDEARLALSRLALTDQLTGLPNRALFQDRLLQVLARRRPVTVLVIDLDDFKAVNDALGHEAGDEVLRSVAGLLRGLCREQDTFARLGGDEFGVLSEDLLDPATALQLAEQLIQGALARPVAVDDREVRVGVSIGVAVADDGSEPLAVLRDANLAMQRAKAAGGARVQLFDQEMRLSAVERLDLVSDLRDAIARQQLVLHYQPEVELRGDRVWAEALVRWQHPQRGLLHPSAFIGVAEDTGVVVDLGRWVLEQATAQLATWRAAADVSAPSSVSVNLSTRQLGDPELVPLTRRLLDQHGLDPASLYFELTETALLREPEESVATLDALRSLGVGLAIDDFGTGYGSLSYMRTLPVDVVKIDRSFVRGIGVDRRDEGIIEAIVTLARSFGVLTVAEGVETDAQLTWLRELGCDFAQGNLLAPPGPAEAIGDWRLRRT